jgi:hypothetical protein
MSVRATHLPELEAPLVMRFQEHGAEVIAEAVVVWRKPADAGSAFGVRFTALDSRSVQALKALCQAEPLPESEADDRPEGDDRDEGDEEYDTEPAPPAMASAPSSLPPSARSVTPSPAPSAVKLHIEGLAAPMQARVRQVGSKQVALASPLEFLRVGRNVDVEDSTLGPRRRARIDRVDVDVDPESQVPELVVSLRYDSTAPPPRVRTARPPATTSRALERELAEDGSLDDADGSDVAGYGERESPALKATVRSLVPGRPRLDERELDAADMRRDGPSLEIDIETDREGLSDAERLRQRLDGVLDELSKAARVARQRARHVGAAATRGARWLATRAESARRSALAAQRALPRRRTASAPRSLRAVALRSQTPNVGDAAPRRLPPRRALAVGAIVIGAAAATWIGRASPRADAVAPSITPAAAASTAAPGSPAPVIIEEIPAPSQRPRLLVPPDDGEPEDVAEPAGVVAQVPLFGPTSLDPAPVRGARAAATRATPERRALARAQSNAGAFAAPAPSSRTKPKAGAEFTSGRLHLPTVHRLRLDEPGATLRGERTPTGFDVIVPGRKTMESGTAIARRDSRIAKVTTKNGSDGARISFRFRSDIPAYKVRLRNDFIEFFISD